MYLIKKHLAGSIRIGVPTLPIIRQMFEHLNDLAKWLFCVYYYSTFNIVLSSLSELFRRFVWKVCFYLCNMKKLDNWISRFEANLLAPYLYYFSRPRLNCGISRKWGTVEKMCHDVSLFSITKSTLVFVKTRQYSFSMLIQISTQGITSHEVWVKRMRDVKQHKEGTQILSYVRYIVNAYRGQAKAVKSTIMFSK